MFSNYHCLAGSFVSLCIHAVLQVYKIEMYIYFVFSSVVSEYSILYIVLLYDTSNIILFCFVACSYLA